MLFGTEGGSQPLIGINNFEIGLEGFNQAALTTPYRDK